MTYQPIVPLSGYAGWKVLTRTMETQKAAFTASATVQSDEEYFRENIGNISSAEELVSDYKLLKVALGAFGLDDDIQNKFFIKKVLEEGTISEDAFANKLTDSRYSDLASAFGFDFTPPNTALSSFSDEILTQYEDRQFELAVGDSDETYRFALNVQRELPELAAEDGSENTKWYTIIGNEALATVVRTGLGLPESVASLDVDQQLTVYKQKAQQVFGSDDVSQFTDSENVEKLIKYYLLREQVMNGSTATSSSSIALTLLQNASSFSARF
ncbi:DUF1217 domain-containing protein [Thioclava sp. GXIMD4216]|uniref:DUF1217 domain-containing protein n=1 Tax=Thioclava litoralis TaxID=3076557 RepID=A0ABZ1DUR3_9RHOB|nr:DUF1217 domain-containing protein [Thioclava sp. FTW29]